MRIALVHYTYRPVIGGVETVMAEHARLFVEAGHSVTIVCGRGSSEGTAVSDASAFPRVAVLSELDTHALPQLERTDQHVTAVRAVRSRLAPLLRDCDLVILHNVATMHFHLALTEALWELANELRNVRFVCWIHDLAACNPYYPLPALTARPWSLLAQAHPCFTYVAVSELRGHQFAQLTGTSESACRVIPNAIDPARLLDLPPRLAELEKREELLGRDVLLLHPARLLRRKNVELTLRVTAALKSAGHSCASLITAPPDVHHAASAKYGQELRELQARLKLNADVLFLNDSPVLDEREVGALFRLADAVFFPSRQEGFGIPLLEAGLHRLPTFCADIAPLNTLKLSHVTPFSLEADPAAIAAMIVERLTSDPAHRARKQVARSSSWTAIYRNFLAPLLAQLDSSRA